MAYWFFFYPLSFFPTFVSFLSLFLSSLQLFLSLYCKFMRIAPHLTKMALNSAHPFRNSLSNPQVSTLQLGRVHAPSSSAHQDAAAFSLCFLSCYWVISCCWSLRPFTKLWPFSQVVLRMTLDATYLRGSVARVPVFHCIATMNLPSELRPSKGENENGNKSQTTLLDGGCCEFPLKH